MSNSIVVVTEKQKMARLFAESVLPDVSEVKAGRRTIGFSGTLNGQSTYVGFTDGHLYKLEEPGKDQWNLDALPFRVPSQYFVEENKKIMAERLHKEIRGAQTLILACDPDAQGTYIAELVRQMSGFKGTALMGSLNAQDPERIREQYRDIRTLPPFTNYLSTAASEACRARLDNHCGINLTVLFTLLGQKAVIGKLGAVLAIGRLQTSILGIVARRYYEIQNFKPQKFYTFSVALAFDDGAKVELDVRGLRAHSEEELNQTLEYLNSKEVINLTALKKTKVVTPPIPFSQPALQIYMGKLYGYSPSEVLDAAAKNYDEGYQLYPRTDGSDIEFMEWKKAAKTFDTISEVLDFDTSVLDFSKKGSTVLHEGVQPNGAHTAIIPTGKKWDLARSGIRYDVFKEVSRRFAMMFMPDQIIDQTTVKAEIGRYELSLTGNTVIQQGWFEYEPLKPKSKTTIIPEFDPDSAFKKIVDYSRSSTRAPNRFLEHEIIEELKNIDRHLPESCKELAQYYEADENAGLGTSATQATAIEKTIGHGIIDRHVEKNKTYLIPSAIGLSLFNALPEELTDISIFAEWERDFIHIKDKKKQMSAVLKQHAEYVDELIKKYKQNTSLFKFSAPVAPTGYECPHCYSIISKLKGKFGDYWRCSNSQTCGVTVPDFNGSPLEILPGHGDPCEEVTDNGPKCNGKLLSYAGLSKPDDNGKQKPYKCLRCDTCRKLKFNRK